MKMVYLGCVACDQTTSQNRLGVLTWASLGRWKWININNIRYAGAAAAKSLQSCRTLCDPIDGSLPGSAVPGILQAILILACASSTPVFHMMYSTYKLNKPGDNIEP